MYNCEDIFEKTDAYLDGELSELEYAEFQKHLEGCEACRNSVEYAKKLNNVMHGMPSVEPPADFLDNLHKKIASEGKAVRFYKKWQSYGALAACLVLAIVIHTNAVKDLNETSSYLKMTTPEPTAQSAEAINETASISETVAEEFAVVQDREEIAEDIPDKASPTAQPTEAAIMPVATAAPTAAVISEHVQPTTDAVKATEAEVAVAYVPETESVGDVPMMLSLQEDMANVAPTEEAAPKAAVPENSTNTASAAVPEIGIDTASAAVSGTVSSSTAAVSGSTSKRTGGSGGGGSSSGGGGSASTGASVTTAASDVSVNYVSAEYKADVEEIIASFGMKKSGGVYTVSKAVFKQFKTALEEKNIPFDGICIADGDDVRFVIEWE